MQTSVRACVGAACAIALLVAGGGTALAAGSPRVAIASLSVVARPAQRTGAAAAIPRAAPFDDSMTEGECRMQPQAYSGQGWGKSRFVSCVAGTFVATKLVCQQNFTNCVPVGSATFDLTNIAHAMNGARQVDVTQTLDNWRPAGDVSGLNLEAQIQCHASNFQSGLCYGSWGGYLVQPVLTWIAAGQTSRTLSFTSPDSSGTGGGPDLISYAFTQSVLTATIPGAPDSTASGIANGFRCDAAPYMVSTFAGEGCVFDWVTEAIHYSLSSPTQGHAAFHILEAQSDPGSTTPPVPGKVIPGAPGGQPLHRITEQAWIDNNTNVATATCNQYFPGYASQGLQCDEYPFKSTLEGAANPGNGYSVLPITASDNMSAGGSLGNFYNARRILGLSDHHDPFFVQVDP
jgi:Deoxyribonuclease NucA/NucB